MSSDDTRSKTAVGFAEAIEAMASRFRNNLEQVLTEVAEGAVRAVPGVIAAIISERDGDRLTTVAQAGQVPAGFVKTQNDLAQGPTLDVADGSALLVVPDATSDDRWPEFAARAGAMGARGLLIAPLALGTRTVGALSLVSTDIDPFDDESEDMAVIFAAHAAITVAGVHRENHLNLAVNSRDVIGQAKGIIMERFSTDDTVAFALLAQISRELNRKLIQVAHHLCLTGELLGTGHPRITR